MLSLYLLHRNWLLAWARKAEITYLCICSIRIGYWLGLERQRSLFVFVPQELVTGLGQKGKDHLSLYLFHRLLARARKAETTYLGICSIGYWLGLERLRFTARLFCLNDLRFLYKIFDITKNQILQPIVISPG